MRKQILSAIAVIGAISLVALFSGTNHVSAGQNKWEEVHAAIANLQQQITDIEQTPGSQGPKGDTGPAGPQGPQGIQGPAGPDISRDRLYQVDSAVVGVEVGPSRHLEATCRDNNDVLLSGSFWVSHAGIRVVQSGARPFYTPATWVVDVIAETAPGLAQASAYCLQVD